MRLSVRDILIAASLWSSLAAGLQAQLLPFGSCRNGMCRNTTVWSTPVAAAPAVVSTPVITTPIVVHTEAAPVVSTPAPPAFAWEQPVAKQVVVSQPVASEFVWEAPVCRVVQSRPAPVARVRVVQRPRRLRQVYRYQTVATAGCDNPNCPCQNCTNPDCNCGSVTATYVYSRPATVVYHRQVAVRERWRPFSRIRSRR